MPPLHVLVKPASGGCGLSCSYCFYADEMSLRAAGNRGMMTPQVQETMIRRVMEEAEGECSFSYQGGEPTLAGLAFFQRAAELERRYAPPGLKIHHAIQTNGVGLDQRWLRFFAQEGYLVGVSLDGTRELHDQFRKDRQGAGTFDRVMETLEQMRREKVEFNILTVVTGETARRAERIYRFFRRQGFRYLQFIPCLDPLEAGERQVYHLTPERYGTFLCRLFDLWYRDVLSGDFPSIRLFDNFLELMLGLPPSTCGVSGYCSLQMVVESDGSVYPCDFYALDETRLGSLLDQPFSKLMQTAAAQRFLIKGNGPAPVCQSCPYLTLCRGGCRRYRDESGRSRFCAAYRQFFQSALPRLELIADRILKRSGG